MTISPLALNESKLLNHFQQIIVTVKTKRQYGLNDKIHVGHTAGEFKDTAGTPAPSETPDTKFIWRLKDNNIEYSIIYKKVDKISKIQQLLEKNQTLSTICLPAREISDYLPSEPCVFEL